MEGLIFGILRYFINYSVFYEQYFENLHNIHFCIVSIDKYSTGG